MKQLTWYLDSFISKYSFGGKPWGLGYGQKRGKPNTKFYLRKGFSLPLPAARSCAFFSIRGLEGSRVSQQPPPPPPQVAGGHSCPSRALAPRAGDLIHLSFRVPTRAHQCATDRPSGELWAQRWVANRFQVRKWPRGARLANRTERGLQDVLFCLFFLKSNRN